ncbi:hypothetical protein D3C78_1099160 [compost metagenome]
MNFAAQARFGAGDSVELTRVTLFGDEDAVVSGIVGHAFEALVVGAGPEREGQSWRILFVDCLAGLFGQAEEHQLLLDFVGNHHQAVAHVGQAFHVLKAIQRILRRDSPLTIDLHQLDWRGVGHRQQTFAVRSEVDSGQIVVDTCYRPRLDLHAVVRQPDAAARPLIGVQATCDVEPCAVMQVELAGSGDDEHQSRQTQAAKTVCKQFLHWLDLVLVLSNCAIHGLSCAANVRQLPSLNLLRDTQRASAFN